MKNLAISLPKRDFAAIKQRIVATIIPTTFKYQTQTSDFVKVKAKGKTQILRLELVEQFLAQLNLNRDVNRAIANSQSQAIAKIFSIAQ